MQLHASTIYFAKNTEYVFTGIRASPKNKAEKNEG